MWQIPCTGLVILSGLRSVPEVTFGCLNCLICGVVEVFIGQEVALCVSQAGFLFAITHLITTVTILCHC